MATLTFEISDSLLKRAHEAAQALDRSVEDILVGALSVSLPDIHDVPASMRSELLEMTDFDEESLWQIATKPHKSTRPRS